MEEQYTDRINRLFQRLSNIQTDVEEEKINRFKALETILLNLEQKVEEINNSKVERHQQLIEKVRLLQGSLEENIEARQKIEASYENAVQHTYLYCFMTKLVIESELGNDLKTLQANCKTIIEASNRDYDDQNRKFLGKINRQIETLAKDLSSELSKQDAQSYLRNFLDEDLPKLRQDLNEEVANRKEMETKIYDQFMGQISELHETFEKDKKEREKRADDFMQLLKKFSDNITDDINASKQEREKNNEMMLNLVENVVERIKKEATEVFH